MSDDGSVVVGVSEQFGVDHEAFRWTDSTGMIGLGRLPGDADSEAGGAPGTDGISGDGTVVVGRSSKPFSWEAFFYTEEEGMRRLGHRNSFAMDASFDGSVLVGFYDNGNNGGGQEAFRWTEDEGFVGLGFLHDGQPDQLSVAYDVSADGAVIAGWNYDPNADIYEIYRWTNETGMENLGVEFDRVGGALAGGPSLSSDGTSIAATAFITSQTDLEAFRWMESTGAVALGWLPDTANADGANISRARDINGDGSVIVGWSGFGHDDGKAFIWSEQYGMEDLKQVLTDRYGLGQSLDGWRLYSAQDISPDGRFIAGFGVNPDGVGEAWLVRLDAAVPEPGGLILAVVGFTALVYGRRLGVVKT